MYAAYNNVGYARIDYRHNNKANICFFDGHVSTRSVSEVPESAGTAVFWQGQ
ncbi:MAG: hypothetical protein PHT33_15950 [bacterium]|nr:hypothetical protein [bacterium]